MAWQPVLASSTRTGDQALLVRKESWVTEHRILRHPITGPYAVERWRT
jgi:hypothetical protein